MPNAWWHLSSISGGLAGHVFKLRSNSETILSQKLLDWEHIRVRRASCMDHLGRDGQMRGNRSWYVATRWSPTRLPAYPDVPRVLEVLLRCDRNVQSTYLSGVDGVEDVGHSTEDSVLDKLLAFHLHGHVNS